MSENIIPEEIRKVAADVENQVVEATEQAAEAVAEKVSDVADKVENLADKSLSELSDMFVELKDSAERMSRSKEAESIKSAFYKLLGRLKGESGVSDETASSQDNPFEAVEQNFKALYADYKKERAEFNKEQDARREENLAKKQAIIEELKALVEGQEDVSAQFPAFRELQNRWREAGPVPATAFRDINDTYQFYVEKFYDMVKINRDLRDLDFRKNLEAKQAFCEAAEKLADNENVVSAFHELQKLHEQWKEYGPVAKEFRDDIWNRFKAATAVVNKRYQAHFEGLKEQQAENLVKKTELCERTEAVAAREIKNTADWNAASKEIEEIQAAWRRIGYATKKDNQKIYDRFRAACDAFYTRKRELYSGIKDSMNDNLEKKLALIEQAEALKTSTEWKKATDQFISLQKQWKEIGAVPRKKSEALWKRFRAACDEFFTARDANAGGENDYYGNLRAKRKVVEDIQAYASAGDAAADETAMREFQERWAAIGHVPFKEKDKIYAQYRELVDKAFETLNMRGTRSSGDGGSRGPRQSSGSDRGLSERDRLVRTYEQRMSELKTFENNMGFLTANTKSGNSLVQEMERRIERLKNEIAELEQKIKELDNA